jgi:hypothetical protein
LTECLEVRASDPDVMNLGDHASNWSKPPRRVWRGSLAAFGSY